MASRSINRAVKRALIEEAGGKCANPGCPNTMTEFHHIKEWHVVKTHDPDHMVCLCPTCHSAVDRGTLRVADEDAYSWKQIIRKASASRGHLYVEPAAVPPKLLLGSVAAMAESGSLAVLSDWPGSALSFRTAGREIMQLNASISDLAGNLLVEVVDGHYEVLETSSATVEQRPGRFVVTHPLNEAVMPAWAVTQVRAQVPGFAAEGRVRILEMNVLRPNVVQVEGVWMRGTVGMVVTGDRLSFLRKGQREPTSLVGAGLASVLVFMGPAVQALFDLAPTTPAEAP